MEKARGMRPSVRRIKARPIRNSVGVVVPVTGTAPGVAEATGDAPATGLPAGVGVGVGEAIVVPPLCEEMVTVEVSVSSVPPESSPVTVKV